MKTSKKSKRKSHKKSITSRSLNYVVAIPSYKRWEEITKKTHAQPYTSSLRCK